MTEPVTVPPEPLRLLIVEDSPTDEKLVLASLRSLGRRIESHRVEDPDAMRAALAAQRWDLVISDWSMPRFSALGALAVLQSTNLDIPFIIVSGTIGEEMAVEAMRAGAQDYVLKGRLARLAPAITRELRESALRQSRRDALDALKSSEARYRRIVETTSHGVWEVDSTDKTTFVNARMVELLGCSASSVVGRALTEFLDQEGRLGFEQNRALNRRGISTQIEVDLHRSDAVVLRVVVDMTPLSEGAHPGGAFAMISDVTERRRAENALRVSEARFRRLWNSGIFLIMISDTEGNIREINESGARMLGYTPEEMVGTLRWAAITPPGWEHVDAVAAAQLASTGVATAWEKELLHKDGRRVPILAGAALLDGREGIAIALDLTTSKETEQRLRDVEAQFRQSQKMEAVGQLAGGVAHDFNNMLSVILGFGELMLSDLKDGDPMRHDVEEICAAGHRAAALTRQLLMFSRQQVLAPKVLDLNEVLLGMDTMLRRLVGEDIDLVLLPAANVARVNADPGSIEQLVMNLVVNARDAMPTGGKLTLEISMIELDEESTRDHSGMTPGHHVLLAVSDTGSGMDKATQARIFEPFFTTKEKTKGTGLGLSTVFGIVKQSGGDVWVYSEPGIGTTFKVYLPRFDGLVTAAPPSVVATSPRGNETILVVEDEDQVRAVALSVLRRHGYRVLEARNAGEALLICERAEEKVDLLLTDVVMPRMSGPELAKRLVEMRPRLKVLFMSGYTDDSVVRHGVLDAEIAYLQKPLTPTAITVKVREVLDAPPQHRR
jgi:two-component system cell cycle sensor histidine kinase/response regulator CckA